jgi:xanthine/uracil/vitamin C permease (AzgA family)
MPGCSTSRSGRVLAEVQESLTSTAQRWVPADTAIPAIILQMQGLINEKADMPRANIAFLADAFGTIMGGLLGSSALTTYVESAAAVKEGGRTGFTAVVCSVFFFLSVFLWPLFR